ncbi:MAG TPA: hypothetical protein DDW21_10775 [Verrucomicrobiales bacterium]|nr:MAG: hypothetical protein CAK88_00260 [Verrucomicrobiae bacterium AMD-G2]HBE23888.1 hypothetical protein [Verrucomicrobiales bacterium]
MDDYDRREFLRTTVPGFLGVLLALPTLCATATRANAQNGRLAKNQAMHWDAFLEAIAKEAATQHLDRWDQELYLKRISALARNLHRDDPVLVKGLAQIRTKLEQGNVDFEYLEKRLDFAICLVQFEKNQIISAHDHPGMTGMILCASGSIHTRNYDLIKETTKKLPDGKEETTCQLHLSAEQLLEKNAITTLTAKARNIHTVKALATTQLIDIFTPPYNDQRSEDSRWFTLDEMPRKGTKNIFDAVVR